MNREIIVLGDHALVPLFGRHEKFYGFSKISLCDVGVAVKTKWTLSAQGYAVGRPPNATNAVKMNRLFLFGVGKNPSIIDHINRDKLDNRRENLRICSQGQNSKNTSRPTNNSSGSKGVTKSRNGTKWRARIWNNRKEIHIGVFETLAEASAAYDNAAVELHGAFASLNTDATP